MKKPTNIALFVIAAAFVLATCGREGPLPPPDKTAPVVLHTVPTDGYQDYPLDGNITITFSKEMDPLTINKETIVLKDHNEFVQETSVTYATNGKDYVAVIKPQQTLTQDMIYTVTVSNTVKDIYGISMSSPVTFFFITQTLLFVQSTTPINTAVDVATNTSIGVRFSKSVNPESLSFNLYSALTGTVACTTDTSLNPSVSFKPSPTQQAPQGLLGYTTYTATISSGLRDYGNGEMLSDYVWSFTTGTDADVHPPEVQATDPANGNSDVAVYPYITVTFNEAVRTSPTTTLTLYSAGTGTISCDRTNENDTQYFYILPATVEKLAYGTQYWATLTAGVEDLAGNAMQTPWTWSFTTVRAATQTAITAPEVTYGSDASVVVLVSASGTGTTPSGNVWLSMDGGSATVKTLSGGSATFPIYGPSAGNHILYASYPTQGVFLASSATGTLTVTQGSTTTTSLQTSANPSTYGSLVTFTATVTAGATGQVTFMDGTTALGSGTLSRGTPNTATFGISSLAVGDHTITAVYGGDANLPGSTSAPLTQTVVGGSSSTSLVQSSASSAYGVPVTFTATVTSSGGIPAGTVTFMDGATTLGSGTLSGGTPNTAAFTTSSLGGGEHSITASYNGSTSFGVSASSAVIHTITNAPTTTSISSSANPSGYGSLVTFTATVTPSAATGTVTFSDGGTSLGTVALSGGTAQFSTSALTAGTHAITATFNPGNANFATSSSALSPVQTVNPVITVSAGAGGSISPSGSVGVSYNASQTFTITPNTGYSIASVVVDGVTQSPVPSSYTFSSVTANHTITASFTLLTFTITPSAGLNGGISPATAQTVNYGSTLTFTFTPDPGYYVSAVTVDGNSVGLPTSYTFYNVTGPHTLSVSFAQGTNILTATAGAGGTITSGGTIVSSGTSEDFLVSYGGSRSFTITPNTGYSIASILVDGVATAQNPYQFVNVTANHSISASFVINTYTVTPSAGANGSISPATLQSVNYNGTTSFTVIPAAGYSTVMGGTCGGTLNGTTYTTNPIIANCTVIANFSVNTFTINATAGANGSISPAGAVAVNYGASQTFTITPNANYHVADVLVDGVSVGAVTSYPFTTVTANHTISASFAINTFTVTPSAGTNGSISPATQQTVNYNGTASFTVTPAAGYSPVMGGTCGGSLNGTTYTTNPIIADCSVTASFTINTLTINATAGANGSISPAGAVGVVYGGSQTFTITPNANYHVADVLVDGVSVGAVTSYPFATVTANHTISASFAINTFTVTPSAGANGSISPATPQTVGYNGTASFTVTPNDGYAAVLDGTCGGSLVGNTYTTNPVTADCTVTASFSMNTYTITTTPGAGGTISPMNPVVNNNGSVTITISPDTGYHVADVQIDGVSVGAVTSYTFTKVRDNHTLSASFAINTFTINATAGANGSISPAGAVAVNYGASQTFTITPNPNYHVADVLVDGASVGAVTSYPFASVAANHTISASFAINTFTINATAGPNGSVNPAGSVAVNYGSNQTFTITPNPNYHVADVLVDGASVGAVTSYPFATVAANHTISASFTINTYTVTPSAGANGSISPTTPQTVDYNGTTSFTVTPAPGYSPVMGGTCGGTLNGEVFTTTPIIGDCTVSATFQIIPLP